MGVRRKNKVRKVAAYANRVKGSNKRRVVSKKFKFPNDETGLEETVTQNYKYLGIMMQ